MLSAPPPITQGVAVRLGAVGWTRGQGCLQLAESLAEHRPVAIKGDPMSGCAENRLDLLVARREAKHPLVPTVSPRGVKLDGVRAITAAIGGGPNAGMVAAVAARLTDSLGVPGELATVYQTEPDLAPALERLDRLGIRYSSLTRRAIKASSATGLVDGLPPASLLVVGAPGGSVFQRQLFGPGHRLLVAAPAGAVVVRDAPRRFFQEMAKATGIAIGPQLAGADALRTMLYPVVPVAENGRLVGMLRLSEAASKPHHRVGDLMDPPVSVLDVDPVGSMAKLSDTLIDSPTPVVDDCGSLLGVILPERIHPEGG